MEPVELPSAKFSTWADGRRLAFEVVCSIFSGPAATLAAAPSDRNLGAAQRTVTY